MTRRILGHFKQRLEDIGNDLFIVLHHAACFVDIIETRHLNEPANIRREQLVVHHPSRKLVPFLKGTTVDRDSPFHHLVFARFQV